MNLYFTRHGQPMILEPSVNPDYPPGNPYLSPLGREQAQLLGERLKSETGIRSIYASPYLRSMDTASIIADILDLPVYPDARYREITTPGTRFLGGHTLDELRERYPRVAKNTKLEFPWWTDVEEAVNEQGRCPEIVKRVTELIEEVRSGTEGDVLLVGHGATVVGAYHYVLDRLPAGGAHPTLYIWNCSLFTAQLDPVVAIRQLDDTSHLPEELVTSNTQSKETVLQRAGLAQSTSAC